MAMGTTSRVVLNDEMQKAKTAFSEYRSKVEGLYGQLTDIVTNLVGTDFSGEAADGFKNFFDNNVATFFAKGEGALDQYLSMFDKDGEGLLDSIEKALTIGEGVDPSLGQNNNSIGGQQSN